MNKWTRPFEGHRASATPAGWPRAAPDHHYFAFLSYSHHDSEVADWLHNELESFRVPSSLAGRLTSTGVVPKRLTPIFRDRHELAASDDLGEEIDEALAASRCLVVICSPAAAKSKWTNAEIDTFKKLHPDGCIIAAVIDGEPLASDIPGREAEECFPPALVAKYNRRGKPTGKKTEPLAADLREGKGGRRIGFLKVVAGMLGLGLDDLVQRDHLRRQRRLAIITASSLVAMFVAIALAVTAIQARDAARDQRREAEGLVGFMLGDLKDKLEPIGKLDALDGVGSRVLAYYQKQDMSDLPDSALLQRSKALSLMAQVAYERGKFDSATALYREAMAGTGEAVARSPEDGERLFQHAQNVFWIGEIARKRGQLKPAEAAYREYKTLADRMVATDGNNLRWRMELAYAHENLGIALYDERRFSEATRQFEQAMGPMQSAAGIDSSNATYQAELANLIGWLAEAHRAEGHLPAAMGYRQRQIAFLDRILAGGSTDVRFREKLIPAHEGLGNLYAAAGMRNESIDHLRTAASVADQLLRVEPSNSFWKRYVGATSLDLARTLLWSGRGEEAANAASAGCQIASAGKWRKLQFDCLSTRARLALASGSPAEAAASLEKALRLAREGTGDPMSDPYQVALSYRLLGDIAKSSGDMPRAAAAWRAGLASLPVNVAERPSEVYEREQLLERLGRNAEAAALAEKLRAIGYRGTV